ncbi:MAG TPA: MarR family transcriptional regulator [Pyrinomonadaceae bacterium]|jgi:DNA-binding MarR family transcriptional regulator|nr:MarR family transcriptional regulator [Pyrinomonadaceae bacterium]
MSAGRVARHKTLAKPEYEKLSAFRYALRRFLRFSEEAAASLGLTPSQHQALLAIKGFPGRDHITNGELAERLQIKHHSAVGLANGLEAQGLIVRGEGERDRRKVHLSLTRRGAELLERLTAIHREELRHVAPQLSVILESLGEEK